jgi:HEPN domain-containing protein
MKTAIEEVFSELENLHPHLFNIYSAEGREFVNHFHKYLEIEKEQIISVYWDAYNEGKYSTDKTAEEYYNETFKQNK